MLRRHVLRSALAAAPLFVVPRRSRAAAQTIRIVLPFGAGGPADGLARLMAEHMHADLGTPTVVENRTGAAGRLGVQAVKAARADGATLLFTPIAPMAVYPSVYKSLGYDPFEDFRPVSQVATFDFGVAVSPKVEASSLAELVAWIKAHPAQANYGSPGAGTLPHLFAVLFGRGAGLALQHVAYKGMAEVVPDLLGGHLPMMFASTDALYQMHKGGRIRVLATSGADRAPNLPEIPTFREAGHDIQGSGWYGMFAPAKTPDEVIANLNAVIVAAIRKPEVVERIGGIGLRPAGTSASAFAEIQRADARFWAAAVKLADFTAED